MKKKRFCVLLLVLLLWLAMGLTDCWRVHGFEKPLFCILMDGQDDGGSGTYVGLGYSFAIQGNFLPEEEFPGVTRYTYKILGMDVHTGIRD